MAENYRIIIVEDEVLIAEDLRDVIESLGYEVADVCHNSERALDQIHTLRPDMVILDINIRGTKTGIEVGQIIQDNYDIPFIYLSSLSDRDTLNKAKITRPRGYLVKPFKDRDLLSTIEMAIYNHTMDLNKGQLSEAYVNSLTNQDLSPKEYEILIDIIDGLNNRQIGEKHFVSVNTIKTHVKRIFSKLEVHDRVSLTKKVTA
ncbi:MAG: response regulator transcription factor [Saprospiraceae bacterium]|nr:response regulator transcription factor [Saprospiraceae bacterium]